MKDFIMLPADWAWFLPDELIGLLARIKHRDRGDGCWAKIDDLRGVQLKDCEALRTQWLTGEAVTPSLARDRERTASNPAAAYAADLKRREQKVDFNNMIGRKVQSDAPRNSFAVVVCRISAVQ